MLLAIDTATQVASVALYDDSRVWAERTWFTERNHTVELMPAITQMFAQQRISPADLIGVAVTIGPGSFTGMRIGLSVAKGIALSLSIPAVGIPTLDVVAEPFSDQRLPVRAVVHAGRGRFCAATYKRQRGKWTQQDEYQLLKPDMLPTGVTVKTIFCGELDREACDAISDALGEGAIIAPPARSLRRAAMLAEMAWKRVVAGKGDDLASMSPIYLHTAQ